MCGIVGIFAHHKAAPPVRVEEVLRIREALRQGALGILVDPDHPDDIQARILEALKRPRGVVPVALDYFSAKILRNVADKSGSTWSNSKQWAEFGI